MIREEFDPFWVGDFALSNIYTNKALSILRIVKGVMTTVKCAFWFTTSIAEYISRLYNLDLLEFRIPAQDSFCDKRWNLKCSNTSLLR